MFGPQLTPLDAQSPVAIRHRSESLGRAGVASVTSNADGPELPVTQPDVTQDEVLASPSTPGNIQRGTSDQGFVRSWAGDDVFGPLPLHGKDPR